MILISLLLHCLLSQCCPTKTDIVNEIQSFSYIVGDSEIIITEYLIKNQSSQEYYTWYHEKTCENISEEFEIKEYFFSCQVNGICLSALLSDNVYYPNFKPIVGVNFLKLVRPGESFSYIFVNADDDYIKNIKYIPKVRLKSYIGDVVNQQFLYGESFIIINE